MPIALPKSEAHGKYVLADGSIIYPSGADYEDRSTGTVIKMPDAGKFMLWHRTGTNSGNGRKVPTGEIIMDSLGPKYFARPIDALLYLNDLQVPISIKV